MGFAWVVLIAIGSLFHYKSENLLLLLNSYLLEIWLYVDVLRG